MSVHRTKRPIPLGKRVASYRSHTPKPWTVGIWMAVPLILVLQLGQVLLGADWLWALAIAGTPLLLWLIWALQIPRRVDLYQNGIDYRVGRRHQYIFWNQIHEIYQTPLYMPHRFSRDRDEPDGWMYRVVHRDGRAIRLYNLESIRMLGQRMQEQIARRQLPVALEAFRAGYSVRFGRRLTISLDGIRVGGARLSWYAVAEISIDETREILITERARPNAPRRLAIRQVPNLLLLDGVLRASQETTDPDSAEVDRRRGTIFDTPSFEFAGGTDVDEPHRRPTESVGESADDHDPLAAQGEEANELHRLLTRRRPK